MYTTHGLDNFSDDYSLALEYADDKLKTPRSAEKKL